MVQSHKLAQRLADAFDVPLSEAIQAAEAFETKAETTIPLASELLLPEGERDLLGW